jgi:hypothetical protein
MNCCILQEATKMFVHKVRANIGFEIQLVVCKISHWPHFQRTPRKSLV